MVELVGRDPLLFARVENDVTTISPEKKLHLQFWPIFFLFFRSKAAVFIAGTFNYLAAEKPTLGAGGCNFKTG